MNLFVTFAIFINRTIGKAKNLKAKIRSLNQTTESLPNSQEPGQSCETKKKKQKMKPNKATKTATSFSTAGIQDEFEFGDVVSILGGAIEQKNPTETPKTTTPFSTAGIQDELEFGAVISFCWGGIAGELRRGDLSQDAEISAGVSHAEDNSGGATSPTPAKTI